jgi:outer membrane protein assembly factor BamD (BamD/ComL family)
MPQTRGREPGESRDQGLAAERRLLELARSALVKGDHDAALASLRRHARGFAEGQLAEERDALLIRALVGKGQYAQARERASRFHRQHPRSLFAGVVEQAMQSIP